VDGMEVIVLNSMSGTHADCNVTYPGWIGEGYCNDLENTKHKTAASGSMVKIVCNEEKNTCVISIINN